MQELKTLNSIAQLMPLERVREVAARHALNADQQGMLDTEVVEALTCAAFGQKFSWFLDTQSVGAREKNLLMNLVWDVAASEHSTRALVFEEQHALSNPLLRDRLVLDYDYSESTNLIRRMVGLNAK